MTTTFSLPFLFKQRSPDAAGARANKKADALRRLLFLLQVETDLCAGAVSLVRIGSSGGKRFVCPFTARAPPREERRTRGLFIDPFRELVQMGDDPYQPVGPGQGL